MTALCVISNLYCCRLQVVILVQLLDTFLMPDDLPPIGEDEQYVYSLPGRKDDKQLTRLMLANAEAQGEG